jgi:hypothetical protein
MFNISSRGLLALLQELYGLEFVPSLYKFEDKLQSTRMLSRWVSNVQSNYPVTQHLNILPAHQLTTLVGFLQRELEIRFKNKFNSVLITYNPTDRPFNVGTSETVSRKIQEFYDRDSESDRPFNMNIDTSDTVLLKIKVFHARDSKIKITRITLPCEIGKFKLNFSNRKKNAECVMSETANELCDANTVIVNGCEQDSVLAYHQRWNNISEEQRQNLLETIEHELSEEKSCDNYVQHALARDKYFHDAWIHRQLVKRNEMEKIPFDEEQKAEDETFLDPDDLDQYDWENENVSESDDEEQKAEDETLLDPGDLDQYDWEEEDVSDSTDEEDVIAAPPRPMPENTSARRAFADSFFDKLTPANYQKTLLRLQKAAPFTIKITGTSFRIETEDLAFFKQTGVSPTTTLLNTVLATFTTKTTKTTLVLSSYVFTKTISATTTIVKKMLKNHVGKAKRVIVPLHEDNDYWSLFVIMRDGNVHVIGSKIKETKAGKLKKIQNRNTCRAIGKAVWGKTFRMKKKFVFRKTRSMHDSDSAMHVFWYGFLANRGLFETQRWKKTHIQPRFLDKMEISKGWALHRLAAFQKRNKKK